MGMNFFKKLLSSTATIYSDKSLSYFLSSSVLEESEFSIDVLYNTFLEGFAQMDYTVIQKVIDISKKYDLKYKYKNSYGVYDYFTIDQIIMSKFFSEDNNLFKPVFLPNANNFEDLKNDNELLSPAYDLLMKIVKNNELTFEIDAHGNTMLHIFAHRVANNMKSYVDFSVIFGRDKIYEVNSLGLTPFGVYVKEKTVNITNKSLVLLNSYGNGVKANINMNYTTDVNHIKKMFSSIHSDILSLSTMLQKVAKTHPGLIIIDSQKNPNSIKKIFEDVALQDKFSKMALYLEKVYTDSSTIKFFVEEKIFSVLEKVLIEVETSEDYNKRSVHKV